MWNLRNLAARPIVVRLTAFLLADGLLEALQDHLADFVSDGFLQLGGTDTLSEFVADAFLELAGTDTLGTSALSDTTTFAPAGTDSVATGTITDSVSATG